ncbi:uncharacterized protein LOC129760309 [Uranotaenia lowii]|uniref:uncharacterized protein LOC129760309 n=1 Tax=Uranotaenia lowii TaxID=190385 RepID=UPI00247AD29B|nr:uncharacterized protein LOC129760309 [Uranotaenia lowii]
MEQEKILEENPHNLDTTLTSNCIMCDQPNTADNMVCCDDCKLWAHYSCAGVTDEIKNHPWSCVKCRHKLKVPKEKKITRKNSSKKGDSGSIRSASGTLESALQQLEDEQQIKERALEEEMILLAKRLEMNRTLQEKRMQKEKELKEKTLQLERDFYARQLQQDKEMYHRQLAEKQDFSRKRLMLKQQFEAEKEEQFSEGDGANPDDDGDSIVEDWLSKMSLTTKPNNFESATQKPCMAGIGESSGVGLTSMSATQFKKGTDAKFRKGGDVNDENQGEHYGFKLGGQISGLTEEELAVIKKLRQSKLAPNSAGSSCVLNDGELTKQQIIARQGTSKTLPIFKGEPELWPIFISSFENTTRSCGFTDLENLKRLQDCLRGDALETVRSILVLPESVPAVINDLRNLFGRPEKLLRALVTKVRKAPSPRLDRMETFIHFGITVKQMCDHLQAAGLDEHLQNPMLVKELSEKLPLDYQIQWVRYKRENADVISHSPLRLFTNFMNSIVADVSEVTDSAFMDNEDRFRGGKGRRKESSHMHSLTPNSSSETQKLSKPCILCNRTDHKLRFCDNFKRLSVTERINLVTRFKLCGVCLNAHGKSKCNFKVRCTIAGCRGGHHPLLHVTEELVQHLNVECNTHDRRSRSVIFRMVPITLFVGDLAFDTLAFLDEGSSATLLEDFVAEQLQAAGSFEPMVVSWTGNVKRYENQSRKINILISPRGSDQKMFLKDVRTVSKLQLPQQKVGFNEIRDKYPHLRNLPAVDHNLEKARIMIGLDNLHVFAPLESRVGQPGEPIAVRSQLGWTIYGSFENGTTSEVSVNFHEVEDLSNQQLHDILRRQYLLDDADNHISPPLSKEHQQALDILQNTTTYSDNKYQTGLIWRNEQRNFPDSFPMANKRSILLAQRLAKNPQLRTNVQRQIQEYVEKGYSHEITQEELDGTPKANIWYLPLNVVTNPRKPDKVRLVWDAAASVQGTSLNSELLPGPDLLVSLPGVICRFREKPVAFGGDIKEMFHQLNIRPEDKQAQRFLFRDDPHQEPTTYVMDVATFGASCSPCTAQFIKNLNARKYSSEFPQAAEAIEYQHYVDDYFDSTDFIEDAVKLASDVKMIHAKGGFLIRNFVSNSQEFLRNMNESELNPSVHFHADKFTQTERVLGLVWHPKQDVFSFSAAFKPELQPVVGGEVAPTKRTILSCIMSLFDPLGLLSPFTVHGKLLVQDLWRTGCGWDETIDEDSVRKWRRWTELLPDIGQLRIPRSYFGCARSDQYDQVQLHVFTDASEAAYGCVAYFCVTVGQEKRCALVMSRTKVSPIKQLSIPRNELQAAVLGARLAKTVRENHRLEINQQYFWTDSQTVLSWIQSDQRRYNPFVGHRIGEILTLTKLSEWRWVERG